MSSVLLILSFAFASFSLLQFNHSESLLLWKLSILCTEFGHWLALLCLVLAALSALSKKRTARFSFFISVFAALSFFRPTIDLAWHFRGWSQGLFNAFDIKDGAPLRFPNFAGLYFGAYREAPVRMQTIKYWESGNDSLLFDYYPAKSSRSENPWVLVVHGGGWDSGDREQLADLNSYLAAQGFAVVSIDYRLAPQAVWPAQKDDVWHAVDYVKLHAKELKLNPARWAILGRSAGGQIAERIAFGPPGKNDPPPLGLIALYAPADLVFAYDLGREDDILKSRVLIRNYLGGTPKEKPAVYRDASPLFWISKDSTPSLLIHGPNDPLVWYVHSKNVYEKLRASGVPAELISIPWATHGFDYNISGPGSLISTYAIELFLRKVLL